MLHFAIGRENKCVSYVQVYRSGIIEAVDAHGFNAEGKEIYVKSLEQKVIDGVKQYLAFQKEIGISPPVILYISLLDICEFGIPKIPGDIFFDNVRTIEKADLIFPDFGFNPYKGKEPFFPPLSNFTHKSLHYKIFISLSNISALHKKEIFITIKMII